MNIYILTLWTSSLLINSYYYNYNYLEIFCMPSSLYLFRLLVNFLFFELTETAVIEINLMQAKNIICMSTEANYNNYG